MPKAVYIHREGQVADASTVTEVVQPEFRLLVIQLDDVANATVSITTSSDPNDAGALWDDVTFGEPTPNTVSVQGPITGVRIEANGDDVDYSILGTL